VGGGQRNERSVQPLFRQLTLTGRSKPQRFGQGRKRIICGFGSWYRRGLKKAEYMGKGRNHRVSGVGISRIYKGGCLNVLESSLQKGVVVLRNLGRNQEGPIGVGDRIAKKKRLSSNEEGTRVEQPKG